MADSTQVNETAFHYAQVAPTKNATFREVRQYALLYDLMDGEIERWVLM
jgi:hypothetical protein